jgi:hypothetical protein
MLTGELPVGRFPPPSKKAAIDARLDQVVLRTLEHEPAERYQHASDIKTEVESVLHTPPPADSELDIMLRHPHAAVRLWMTQPGYARWVGMPMFVLLALYVLAIAGLIFAFITEKHVMARWAELGLLVCVGPTLLVMAFGTLNSVWAAGRRQASTWAAVNVRERTVPSPRRPRDSWGGARGPSELAGYGRWVLIPTLGLLGLSLLIPMAFAAAEPHRSVDAMASVLLTLTAIAFFLLNVIWLLWGRPR